jgi:hypothetical protein
MLEGVCRYYAFFAYGAREERHPFHKAVRMHELATHWTDFDEIRHVRYAIGCHSKFVDFNLIRSVITLWWVLELVKWT